MSYSPWEMLSALATVAAVLVALGVSGHTAWTVRRAEKDRSELAAAKMLSPITALGSVRNPEKPNRRPSEAEVL